MAVGNYVIAIIRVGVKSIVLNVRYYTWPLLLQRILSSKQTEEVCPDCATL